MPVTSIDRIAGLERPTGSPGQRYSLLTVVRELEPTPRNKQGKRRRVVLCACDCGKEVPVRLYNLQSGNSKSCGCQKIEALSRHNALVAAAQIWCFDGGQAYIYIKNIKCLIDADDVDLVGKYRWHLDDSGYVETTRRYFGKGLHRLVLRLSADDSREGDHINHNLSDNRKSQIRAITTLQNKMNRRGWGSATSRFKGVSWDSRRKKWRAQLNEGSIHKNLGRFDSEEEAADAYDQAAIKHFGGFAFLNLKEKSNARYAD